MDSSELADRIVAGLQSQMATLPPDFYATFNYTQTGNNYTHPVTLGFLARILRDIPGTEWVAIDLRLNRGRRVKFQPDLAALRANREPIAFVDYESPNSSDSRLPEKDVKAYLDWLGDSKPGVPYVIVTTLPSLPTPGWELRYASPGYYNEGYRGREDEIRENPYRFWYGVFAENPLWKQMRDVAFVNIDGTAVKKVDLESWRR